MNYNPISDIEDLARWLIADRLMAEIAEIAEIDGQTVDGSACVEDWDPEFDPRHELRNYLTRSE